MRSLLIATPGLLDWSKKVQANFSQTALKEHELTEIWALTVAMWKEELKKVCVYIRYCRNQINILTPLFLKGGREYIENGAER